jgi:hypothetical protein
MSSNQSSIKEGYLLYSPLNKGESRKIENLNYLNIPIFILELHSADRSNNRSNQT